MGLDYSRFTNAGGDSAITPRFEFSSTPMRGTRCGRRTPLEATKPLSRAPRHLKTRRCSSASRDRRQSPSWADAQSWARAGGSEFGVQRVLDNRSNVDAAAFLDMRPVVAGVGLMAMPLSAFSGDAALPLMNVANQNGSACGMRVVYSRRLNDVWSASAGYSLWSRAETVGNSPSAIQPISSAMGSSKRPHSR